MIDQRDKKVIHSRWNLKILWIYIKVGIIKIYNSIGLKIVSLLFLSAVVILGVLFIFTCNINSSFFPQKFTDLANVIRVILSVIVMIILVASFLYFVGRPFGAKRFSDNLKRAGFLNHTLEAPLLLSNKKSNNNQRVHSYVFHTRGIPFEQWEKNKQSLESALNLKIDRIEEGNNSTEVVIYAVCGNYTLPKSIKWKSKYLITEEKGFTLVLGENIIGEKVCVNLSELPHIMIGGGTGSGKTWLLRLMMLQALEKKALVICVDFKGGLDFCRWQNKCKIVVDTTELISVLEDIVSILQKRRTLLREVGAINVDEYNQIVPKSKRLQRVIIALDEIAEVLSKTALSKSEKEDVNKIERFLSVICCQGRSFNINAILCTQRPSADLLTGSIRSNLLYRICGRCDAILAQIVLDSAEIAKSVSMSSIGRFVDNNGELFQAYWFDDKELL